MALIETLTVNLSAALCKVAARQWLKIPGLVGGSEAIIDTAKKRFEDFRVANAAQNILRSVETEVAERLERFLLVEFPSMPENEQTAAALAVSDCFKALDLTDSLLNANLDAATLADAVRKKLPRAFGQLGQTAYFADRLLEECCHYVVGIADRLPDFQIAATREQLRREAVILTEIKQVFDQVEKIRINTEGFTSEARASGDFGNQYRRTLAQQLDRLDMFGLRAAGARTRMPGLSDTYVPLTALPQGEEIIRGIEESLARQARTLIRGEAGSGKTTLMQWLALQAAQRGFAGSLSLWNDRMPFYIRLRDFVETEFPPPEHFLSNGAARNVAGRMPPGWVHAELKRGLILLDGVDEIPADHRPEWSEWIERLMLDFPEAYFVVSSRPAALEAPQRPTISDRLDRAGFVALTLEPMSIADSEALITRWHAAVARDLPDSEDRASLSHYEHSLRAALYSRPAIRNLAGTPLLCMMMCALNWLQKQRLPDERMKLYQQALDMLLEGREAERQIRFAHVGGRFSQADREALIDGLAYWMLSNGLSETNRDNALAALDRILPRLAHLQESSATYLQELLERSGVLRQPQHDTVDFIHRTFMEYMGAREAIANRDINLLVERASTENWREVVVFAAGHTRGKDRDNFVEQLLEGPLVKLLSSQPRLQVTKAPEAFVAATTVVCCLETVENLDKSLLERLQRLAARLFPPTNFTQAQLLAPAAISNPSLLRGHRKRGARIVAACIRAASIIATGEMLEVIESYADAPVEGVEGVEAVETEIVRAWPMFDRDEFARRVFMRRRTLFNMQLPTRPVEEIECLTIGMLELTSMGGGIDAMKHMFVNFCRLRILRLGRHFISQETLGRVGRLSSLRSLDLTLAKGVESETLLPLFKGLKQLEVLTLNAAQGVEVTLPYGTMHALRRIHVTNPSPSWFAGIDSSSGLVEVHMSVNWDHAARILRERGEDIGNWLYSHRSATLESFPALESHSRWGFVDGEQSNVISERWSATEPQDIVTFSLSDLHLPLDTLPSSLTSLTISQNNIPAVGLDLSTLAEVSHLEELSVDKSYLVNVAALRMSRLRRITFDGCFGPLLLETVEALREGGCEVNLRDIPNDLRCLVVVRRPSAGVTP